MEQPLKRPEVVRIVMTLRMPSGEEVESVIHPMKDQMMALFWTDVSVKKILAPYYDQVETWHAEAELVRFFGKDVMSLVPRLGLEKRNNTAGVLEYRVSPALIQACWDRYPYPYGGKTTPCPSLFPLI